MKPENQSLDTTQPTTQNKLFASKTHRVLKQTIESFYCVPS